MTDNAGNQPLSELEQRLLECLKPLEAYLEATWSGSLRSHISVSDVVNETYLRASENLETVDYRGETKFLAWLKKIAANVARDALRRSKRESSFDVQGDIRLANMLVDSGDLTPSQILSKEENRQVVILAISRLSDQDRQLLALRYSQGMKFKEIGELLGRTEASARGLHRDVLSRLREKFASMSLHLSEILGRT